MVVATRQKQEEETIVREVLTKIPEYVTSNRGLVLIKLSIRLDELGEARRTINDDTKEKLLPRIQHVVILGTTVEELSREQRNEEFLKSRFHEVGEVTKKH